MGDEPMDSKISKEIWYLRTYLTFLSLFQSQIEDIESKHSSEVAKLQKQIDDLDNQVLRLQMSNKRWVIRVIPSNLVLITCFFLAI